MSDWADNTNINTEEAATFVETLEIIVRKMAHFIIFATLGFCVTNAVRQIIHKKKNIFLISLWIGSLYAATDELHQHFVPGRSCMWQDWALDTAGVLFGIAAAFFMGWVTGKIREKSKRNKKILELKVEVK